MKSVIFNFSVINILGENIKKHENNGHLLVIFVP